MGKLFGILFFSSIGLLAIFGILLIMPRDTGSYCIDETPETKASMYATIQGGIDKCNLYADNYDDLTDSATIICKVSINFSNNGSDNKQSVVLKEIHPSDLAGVSGQFRLLTPDEALSDVPWCKQ